jgi:hypothetical protein
VHFVKDDLFTGLLFFSGGIQILFTDVKEKGRALEARPGI